MSEECSQLLKRMELEDSDDEYDLPDDAMVYEVQQETTMSLEDVGLMENNEEQVVKISEDDKKQQKRKKKWGPVERFRRPRRGVEDGLTILEKAQELKAYQNLEKGKPPKSFASLSNASLLTKAQSVNINLGKDLSEANLVIDNLKNKERVISENFEEDNPEVNLHLNLEVMESEFPPLSSISKNNRRSNKELADQTWAQIVSTDIAQKNNQSIK